VIHKNILVVDDNDVNQKVAMRMLSNFKFMNCHKADDGLKALELMKKMSYDLVLMDCMMPIMDGYQATREYRMWEKQNNLSPTTIIGLTANGLKQDEALCLNAGMDLYCRKPLTRKNLSGILVKCLLGRVINNGHIKQI